MGKKKLRGKKEGENRGQLDSWNALGSTELYAYILPLSREQTNPAGGKKKRDCSGHHDNFRMGQNCSVDKLSVELMTRIMQPSGAAALSKLTVAVCTNCIGGLVLLLITASTNFLKKSVSVGVNASAWNEYSQLITHHCWLEPIGPRCAIDCFHYMSMQRDTRTREVSQQHKYTSRQGRQVCFCGTRAHAIAIEHANAIERTHTDQRLNKKEPSQVQLKH